MNCFAKTLLLLVGLGCCSGRASAQDADDPSSRATPTGVEVTMSPSGARRHAAGRWAELNLTAKNWTGRDVEQMAAVYLGKQSDLQFARKMWVPAKAQRRSPLPILFPARILVTENLIGATMMQLSSGDGEEGFQTNSLGEARSERSLMLSWEESRTAFLLDQLDPEGGGADPELLEQISQTVYAGRASAKFIRQDLGAVRLDSSFLPSSPQALDALDQVVIASNRVANDSVGMASLRSWVEDGGRLWIMLGHVSPETLRILLGDATFVTAVDQVELNEFSMELSEPVESATSDPGAETWSSEKAALLTRVFTDSDDIHSRIDGWPTAFWHKVGSGEVLVTTLTSNAWMNGDDPTAAYTSLAKRFFDTRDVHVVKTESMIPMIDDKIGYEIPSSRFAASFLGAHVLLILAAGAYWAHRRRLEWMAVLIPVASLVTGGIFMISGLRRTTAVPSTLATGQIVKYSPELATARISSVSAIYSQQAQSLDPDTSSNAVTMLKQGESSGTVSRVVWDDRGHSQWDSELPPASVRHFDSEAIVPLTSPVFVKGTFNESGFEGRICGVEDTVREDAILFAHGAPSIPATFGAGGSSATVNGGADDIFVPGQFMKESLLTDVQQARQQLMRELLSGEVASVGREPCLLYWTDDVTTEFQFDESYERRGAALKAIPVRIDRLPSDSKFHVPATFVRLDTVAGDRGVSSVYNPRTGQWLDRMSKPARVELRCLVPEELLPCRIDQVQLSIKISAPARTLEIFGSNDGEEVSLLRRENPTGTLKVTFDDRDAIQVDEQGGIRLSLAVSNTTDEQREGGVQERTEVSKNVWRIDFVHVGVNGAVQ